MKVMIVGVGGQGTLLASRVLGAVALDEGYDVKMSEVQDVYKRQTFERGHLCGRCYESSYAGF